MPRFSFRTLLLVSGILMIPVFGYLFWPATDQTLSLLTKDYQETGTSVKQDFQSLPTLPLTEEESSFTLTDTTAEGIDIKFANQASGSAPDGKKGLSLSFPKDYSRPIEVKLDGQRTVTITDLGGKSDYRADTLSEDQTEEELSFLQKLFGKKKTLSQNYLRYQSKDERKSLLYAYQKDQATGEKKLKHWTFYREGNGVEQESYQIDSAKVKVNQEGVAEVFYYGEQALKNDQVAAEVDSNLMERAQRTLAKEMGEDLLSGNHTPDFTIPKPYYIDNRGEKHEAEWKWSEENKTLSVSFSPESYPVALDPTLSFTVPGVSNGGSVIGGETTSNSFGISIAAGDFNADGKMDLAVGASVYSSSTGRVYIFYNDGSYVANAKNADAIITGTSGNLFGASLAAGDFNADGKTDLAVGIYQNIVYIYYNDGSYPTAAASANVTITGDASSEFGNALMSGDFDADGDSDLAVGARAYSTNTGRVYVFNNDGSIPTTAGTADAIITGESTNTYLGTIFAAGDVNADGKIDLIVGAQGYTSFTGRAYIFYNGSITTENASGADVTITGAATGDYFSSGLATGDFDADGDTDLAIGARGVSSAAGRVYIFNNDGSIPTTAGTADTTLSNSSGVGYFGNTLAAGDMNADGKADLIVSATDYSSANGAVFIFYNDGSIPTNATSSDVRISGESANNSNVILFAVADFNSDGKIDLATSFAGYSTNTGRVYVFYSQNGTVNTNQTFTGETTGNYFGAATATGDFNADGRIDLAVGAYGYSTNAGRTYIFYGDGQVPTTAATADVTITGEASSDFGVALAAGDFNADGETDLAVGASGYSSSSGRAYIFYNDGSIPTTAATADVLINNESSSSRFGYRMIGGDFNADSKTDLVVGAFGYANGNENGRAYLFTADGTNNFGTASCTGSSPTVCAGSNADALITGENLGDRFTIAFAAGDFNADGKTDLAVGAYAYSSTTGRVYIFYNGSITTEAASGADVIITGAGSGNAFGLAVAAGDLNADGKVDLVVGADGVGGLAEGAAYIFYNGSIVTESASGADVTITNNVSYQYFGATVATGDWNADGRTDLAVSARHYDSYVGRVFLFYNDGSIPTTPATADVLIIGTATSDEFGVSLATGDINGDGRADLIVGSSQYSTNTGQVYIYETRENFAWEIQKQVGSGLPRTGLNTSGEEMSITGQATSNFGYAVGSGDFNADGKVDLAVGANTYVSNTGRVYLFYSDGSLATGAANADVVITGGATSNQFGAALTSGDMNGDGTIDLVVGAFGYSSTTGRAYIFYNDGAYPSNATSADVFVDGETASDRFAEIVRTGDLNADGRTDLVIGSRAYSSSTGRAYVFYSDGSMPTTGATADAIITGETTSNSLGAGLATGDFNADGKVDLAVGAWGWTTSTGRAYIFYNGSIITENASAADVIISGNATNDLFGITLEDGDFNADGKTDLIAAARNYSGLLGRVYIFYNDGSIPTTAATADVTISGESSGSYFGGAIRAADFNGDGRTDFAVGANLTSSTAGRAFIFYNDGSYPATGASADVIFTGGEAASDAFGTSLAAGDFNADGEMDLAVGAYGYSSTAGKVYVYTFNDTVITGGTTSDQFGIAMTAGDFNADGRVDLVVGASGYSTGTGRAYVFYNDGNIPSAVASADAIITGGATSNYFGYAFTSGDFNADGKVDLAVGAWGYSSNTGRAYIFYNGSIITENASGADVTITGNATDDYFGYALTRADFNRDGEIDLAAGAWQYSGRVGRVYIFHNDGSIPTTAATADVTITGAGANTAFGVVLTTGDLNSDGWEDLAVGGTGNGNELRGDVYIFYNDGAIPTSASSADVTIAGTSANDRFGNSLVTGDFNANGKIDLAVGAPSSASNGRIYIFYNDGSIPTTAATADVIIDGQSGGPWTGSALAAGDFNADGKTDLVVGAHLYSGTSFSEIGRVYVLYNDGAYPSSMNSADRVLTGEHIANYQYFGFVIAAADFNTDGKADLAVGAYGYSSSTGRVYTFISEAAKAIQLPGTMYLKGTGKMKGTGKIK